MSAASGAHEFLARILSHKREEVARAQQRIPAKQLERQCLALPPVKNFAAALLQGEHVNIIAEMKRASPSAGLLRVDFNPALLAASYARHGAAAISVLTDEHFFGGSLWHLQQARAACAAPLLRKDFIVAPYQILEARAHGADAVLLIVAAFSPSELTQLLAEAHGLGMQALVEVHREEELEIALAHAAAIIGINHRNLGTFEVSLETTARLAPLLPSHRVIVAESGIRTAADIEQLAEYGIDAVLVGSHLMTQPDPGKAVHQLQGVSRRASRKNLWHHTN